MKLNSFVCCPLTLIYSWILFYFYKCKIVKEASLDYYTISFLGTNNYSIQFLVLQFLRSTYKDKFTVAELLELMKSLVWLCFNQAVVFYSVVISFPPQNWPTARLEVGDGWRECNG